MEYTANENGREMKLKLEDIAVRVDRIIVDGVGRTKDHVILDSVKPILSATNFQDMLLESHAAKHHMEKLGIFKNIRITVDSSKTITSAHNGYEVIFDVEELKRASGGINTLVGTNDANLLFDVRLPNVWGRGEKLSMEYSHGTRNSRGASVLFNKPIGSNPDLVFSTHGSQSHGESPWSMYKQTNRQLATDFTFPTLLGVHTIKWEGVWRDLRALPFANFAIRENAGHSVKSSISHTVSRDSRDDHILPSCGSFLRFYQEYAGIGGDVQFEKYQFQLQLNKSLPLRTIVQLSLDTGLMTSPHDVRKKVNDLFTLGGPLTLRGFTFNGIAPRAGGCSLGGHAYWMSGVHLYTPLPFSPGRGGFGELFRSHLFMTAGNLYDPHDDTRADSWFNLWRYMSDKTRLSCGAGIVIQMGGVARLELNYVIPLLVCQDDSVCRGAQFGIGVWYS